MRVVGMETRADSMFLNDPPLTLYSIYRKIVHYFRDGRPKKTYYSKVITCLELLDINGFCFLFSLKIYSSDLLFAAYLYYITMCFKVAYCFLDAGKMLHSV